VTATRPRAAPSFAARFGREPAVVAEAPGRVNLIGEHTDYSGGFVLPIAIPLRTRVELAPRGDARVRVASVDAGEPDLAEYVLGAEAVRRAWFDYVQGVTFALRAAGIAVGGFEARVSSAVPLGAGLSSSAALEVALLRALRAAFDLSIDDLAIARLGRAAENDFIGAPVGIMDQLASSIGDPSAALFVDTRSLAFERVPLPAGVELLVIDSGVAHDHAAGDYRTRRAEVERAAALLSVPTLRDVDESRLGDVARLPPPLDRRARHVVTENARVLAAVAAIRAGDVVELGRLFDRSHASMRYDFEVSVPAVDRIVELARAEPDVYGARLTGGGFGGAAVALARAGTARPVGRRIAALAGERARVLVPGALEGGGP